VDVNAESSLLQPANRDGGIDQDWAGDDQDWWDWYVTLPIRISARPRGHAGMHARLSGACQAGTRGRRGPSVAVRGTADGAHRPSWRPDAVRYMSVDAATQRSTAVQGDT
jgi:hypothetical protein